MPCAGYFDDKKYGLSIMHILLRDFVGKLVGGDESKPVYFLTSNRIWTVLVAFCSIFVQYHLTKCSL